MSRVEPPMHLSLPCPILLATSYHFQILLIEKMSWWFQPGIFLTILQQAYGAVASRLSTLFKIGYRNNRCWTRGGRIFSKILDKGRLEQAINQVFKRRNV
jgi:hypothetical protein